MWVTPQNKLRLLYEKRQFFITKHFRGYTIDPVPSFDPDGLAYFEKRLSGTNRYIEYGSGGSTLLAVAMGTSIVTVESDRVFAKAVEDEVYRTTKASAVTILYANIGLTEEWGYPMFTKPTPRRIRAWKGYIQAPWIHTKGSGFKPDTVLIDGRFRVACAFETLMRCDRDTCILVDDYTHRPVYNPIERHADLIATHGRMAEFRKKKDFNEAACENDLTRYSLEPI